MVVFALVDVYDVPPRVDHVTLSPRNCSTWRTVVPSLPKSTRRVSKAVTRASIAVAQATEVTGSLIPRSRYSEAVERGLGGGDRRRDGGERHHGEESANNNLLRRLRRAPVLESALLPRLNALRRDASLAPLGSASDTCSTGYQGDESLVAAAIEALRREPVRVLVTLAKPSGTALPQAANVRMNDS